MDREKILAAAQSNKKRGCEYENREGLRGSVLAELITLAVLFILFLLEACVNKTYNVSLGAAATTIAGVDALYEGIKAKKRYLILVGILTLLLAVICIVAFVRQVIGV